MTGLNHSKNWSVHMASWNAFLNAIKSFKPLFDDLNGPSSEVEIINAEYELKLSFLEELNNVYLSNNGQLGNEKGVFKALSGYDVYKRPKLLSFSSIINLKNVLLKNSNFGAYFKSTYIPFACDDENYPDNVFCVDSESGEVYLLWVSTPDWTLPVDWQLLKVKQANTLEAFLEIQTMYYRIQ